MPSDTLLVLTRSQIDKKDLQHKLCQDHTQRLLAELALYKKTEVISKSIEGNYEALTKDYQQKITLFQNREWAYTDSLRVARGRSLRLGKTLKLALPVGIVAGFLLGTKF